MTVTDIMFDLPKIISDFCEKLLSVLTTEIEIAGYSISLWGILATASIAVLVAILVYSIIAG